METHLVLLALLWPAVAASPVSVGDVSERFDGSLGRMVKRLRDAGEEAVEVGEFPVGRYKIQGAHLGNLTTLRRTSDASLVVVAGRQYVQGGVALGEMVISGGVAYVDHRLVREPKLLVRENFWDYKLSLNPDSETCADNVAVLPLDLGQMFLSSGDGQLTGEEEVTEVVKHSLTEVARQRINKAMTAVFEVHFDFCHLIRD